MNCKVILKNGEETFISSGELNKTVDGFKLSYSLDGDACEITYNGAVLRQVRRGRLNVDIQFKEAAETSCKVGDGALSGEFPVFTQKLVCIIGAGGVGITIKYDCGGGEVNLALTALKTEEKK